MIVNNIYKRDFLNRMESLLPADKDFYHVDVNIPNNFSELQDVSPNLHIVFNCAMEGWRSIVDKIYEEAVIKANINEERIFLVSGATDIKDIVNESAIKFNKKLFDSIWMREFEHFVSYRSGKYADYTPPTKYEKAFICLNRRWRLHRPVLVAMLANYNLLRYGYVSLDNSEYMGYGWDDIKESITETHKNCKEISNYVSSNIEYLKSITPLNLDTQASKLVKPYELQEELDVYYRNSYFSLVSETNFYTQAELYNFNLMRHCEGTRFLTEKTFKPMVYRHPFILMSTPRMLELLRDLGYKTFHPYINEDYDTEENDSERLIKILSETRRLSKFNKQELQEFLNNTRPICEHNFNVLSTRYSELFTNSHANDFRS